MRTEIKQTFGLVLVVCALGYMDARSHTSVARFQSPAKDAAPNTITIRRRAVFADVAGTDISSLTLSADGRLLATGTGRGPVKLWNTENGQLIAELNRTEGQSPRAFSPIDDRLLLLTTSKSVSLYDINAMKVRSYVKFEKLGSFTIFESFSPDGELFLMDSVDKGKITVWETKTGQMLASIACSDPFFNSTFSPDSKTFVTSCGTRKTKLWDPRSGKLIAEFSSPENVLASVFSPDGQTLSTITTDGQILNWDVGTRQLKNSWGEKNQIYDAKLSPDGKVLGTVCWGGAAFFWDVESQRLKYSLRVSRSATGIHFSADGRFVTSNGHKGEVAVWNVTDGSTVLMITEHQKDIRYVHFSPDNRLVVSYSKDAVNVWDLDRRVHVTKLADVTSAFFSKDGKLLVSNGPKGSVILWEVVS